MRVPLHYIAYADTCADTRLALEGTRFWKACCNVRSGNAIADQTTAIVRARTMSVPGGRSEVAGQRSN